MDPTLEQKKIEKDLTDNQCKYMQKFIPQMQPTFGKEEKTALSEYMDEGGFLTEFKKTKIFEEMIAILPGVPSRTWGKNDRAVKNTPTILVISTPAIEAVS